MKKLSNLWELSTYMYYNYTKIHIMLRLIYTLIFTSTHVCLAETKIKLLYSRIAGNTGGN